MSNEKSQMTNGKSEVHSPKSRYSQVNQSNRSNRSKRPPSPGKHTGEERKVQDRPERYQRQPYPARRKHGKKNIDGKHCQRVARNAEYKTYRDEEEPVACHPDAVSRPQLNPAH